jgi:hypothetical protein
VNELLKLVSLRGQLESSVILTMQSLRETRDSIACRQKVLAESHDFNRPFHQLADAYSDAELPADTQDVLLALQSGDLSSIPGDWFQVACSPIGGYEVEFADDDSESNEPSSFKED